jgi:hypothetical protein
MKPALTILCLFAIISFGSMTTISCTKTTVTHDSTTVKIYDTTTVRVYDTVYSKAKNPITGLWVGTFKNDGDAVDSFYYAFDILSNDRMEATDVGGNGDASAVTGTWQLNGTTFTSTLYALNPSGQIQAVSATYDSVAGTLKGTTDFTANGTVNSSFLLFRVQ